VNFDTKSLYDLLPSFWKLRDLSAGAPAGPDGLPRSPLWVLLQAFSAELAGLEENLDQLYDDQFIETCADWAVPYIGDLIGYRSLYGVTPQVASPRAEVADTIALRRRKGTVMVLEQLARDVTGWEAHAVECFQILSWSQCMKHLRPGKGGTADLRDADSTARVGGAYDSLPRSIDVRRIADRAGRCNIPDIAIFLWRLRPRPLRGSPVVATDSVRLRFHPLGIDHPLFFRGRQVQGDLQFLAVPGDTPDPIGRRFLDASMDVLYGDPGNFRILVDGTDVVPPGTAPSAALCSCDLDDLDPALGDAGGWAHLPAAGGRIAVDPVLGRIALPPELAGKSVSVFFHYAFAADIGGGDYARTASFAAFPAPPTMVKVPSDQPTITAALAYLAGLSAQDQADAVVEVEDNGLYAETPVVTVAASQRLEIRSSDGNRPHLLLGGDLAVSAAAGSVVSLNGFLVSGGAVHLSGTPESFAISHCTLVPGRSLSPDGSPLAPHAPSLVCDPPGFDPNSDKTVAVSVDHCILGPVRVPADGIRLTVLDSVLDSPDRDPTSAVAALAASDDGTVAGPPSTLQRCTVLGRIHVRELDLASDCLVDGTAQVDRRQAGCARFSYFAPDSVLPRAFRCQPTTAIGEAWDKLQTAQGGTPLTLAQKDAARVLVENRLRPDFAETRYGRPSYGLLSEACATEIAAGASDESEMGAFHDLFQPQKEGNLRIRLEEYLRFGLEAGIFHAT
jgi:hypothetical protein